MSHVELPEEINFSTKFDTFIIAYCPDTDSWFVTKERFFTMNIQRNLCQKKMAFVISKIISDCFLIE